MSMPLDKTLAFLLEVIRIFRPVQRQWIVRVFVIAGLPLVTFRFWQPWVERWLEMEFGLNLSYTAAPGWVLLGVGVLFHVVNLYLERQSKKEPTFKEDRDNLMFSLGGGMTCGYSVEQLRKGPATPFNFGGHLPIKVYLKGRKLFADVEVFPGAGLPPIKIIGNKLSGLPPNWDSNKNESALEIVNQNFVPVYQFIYKNDGHVVLNGVFPFPSGVVLADAGKMVINPTMPAKLSLARLFKYPSWKYPAVYET